MKLRVLICLSGLLCIPRGMLATTCSRMPPCASVHPGSILFVGTAVDPGIARAGERAEMWDVRVLVQEIFEGLTPDTREVTVTTEGSWLEKGAQYLFDTGKGEDGRLYPTICGNTAEITYQPIAEVLQYLRQRASGKAVTSLSIRVTDQYKPVPDADVTISGPSGKLVNSTGSDGSAIFSGIPSARYRVAVEKKHYHVESAQDIEADASAGACSSAQVSIQAEAAVTGLVRDSNGLPVGSLPLELIAAPEHPTDELSLTGGLFDATTNARGEFVFESVSPGRYLLGSNIVGLGTSPIPPAFYPGNRERAGAIPIEVTLGETNGNLVLTLPDFGMEREIRLCVVDEADRPVPAAQIGKSLSEIEGAAGLGENLITGDNGCVQARGYALATYEVQATFRPQGADWRETRTSDSLVISQGDEPVHKTLKLGRPIGALVPKRQ